MKERIIGHRGAGVLAPENTIEALEKAATLGLSHVEFDVRLTKDHIPVISHDDSLMRCAHQNSLISNMNYVDLKDINIAGHFALAAMNAKIPTLEEYLGKAKELGLHCQIELKPNKGDEFLLPEIVGDVLDTFYADTSNKDLPLITSFAAESLKALKSHTYKQFQTGILIKTDTTSLWEDYATRAQADYIHVHALYLTDDIANDIKNKGYKINAYHLNHPEVARKAIERGCEKFTCDIPDIFLKG